MEHIIVFASCFGLFIHDERVLPGEAIVGDSDHFRVSNRMAFLLGGQSGGKGAQVGELGSKLDFRAIHEDGQYSLRCTSVVNDLIGEEELGVVISQCLWLVWRWLPLEQKDESVDGPAYKAKAKFLVKLSICGIESKSKGVHYQSTYWILFSSSSSSVISSST